MTQCGAYQSLTKDQKEEFNDIVNGLNLSYNEQVTLLNQYAKQHPSTKIQTKWKTSIIKAIAKLIIAKTGEKSAADVTDFLFGWEGDLQSGIEHYLVHHEHWNKTVAYWTAKSIMFIAF